VRSDLDGATSHPRTFDIDAKAAMIGGMASSSRNRSLI
jgi:hypothetical protein